jgi:hypothetical protein
VRLGEETDAGDLRPLRGKMLRIRATIVDSHGRPPVPNRTTVSLSHAGGGMSRGLDAAGRFESQPCAPGVYRLEVAMRAESGQMLSEYASQTIALDDADVELVLGMKPAVPVKGRVIVEDSPSIPQTSLSVRAEAAASNPSGLFFDKTAAVLNDRTFSLPPIAGAWLLRIQGTPPNSPLGLRAVMRGEEDVTDIPTEFKADDAIRVVLGPLNTGLQGTVTFDSGKPAAGYAVLAFSEDRRTWVRMSTRVRSDIRTDRTGHYATRVPPGRYYVVAVTTERTMPWPDVDAKVLEAVLPEATRVVVNDDEIRVVDLRVPDPRG